MNDLYDERTDAEVSRRINSAPFMTYKEECESLREQVEKLTKERDIKEHCIVQLEAEDLRMKERLAALAEQNERMRVALQAMVDEAFARSCGLKIADDAIALPDLASPVLNRIKAETLEAFKVELMYLVANGEASISETSVAVDALEARIDKLTNKEKGD